MRYSISCIDAGVQCSYVAKADSLEEVVRIMTEHAQDAHAETVRTLLETMTPDELTQWLIEKVKTHPAEMMKPQ